MNSGTTRYGVFDQLADKFVVHDLYSYEQACRKADELNQGTGRRWASREVTAAERRAQRRAYRRQSWKIDRATIATLVDSWPIFAFIVWPVVCVFAIPVVLLVDGYDSYRRWSAERR